MNKQEFITAFVSYYDIEKSETSKLRINMLCDFIESEKISWVEAFKILTTMFTPTQLNKYPLIAHLNDFLNKAKVDQDKNNKQDAQNAADRIIEAVSKFGHLDIGNAKSYIGDLGWQAINQGYGNWFAFASELQLDQVELVRAHLRDSILSLQNRQARGVFNQAPSLCKNSQPVPIGDLIKKIGDKQ